MGGGGVELCSSPDTSDHCCVINLYFTISDDISGILYDVCVCSTCSAVFTHMSERYILKKTLGGGFLAILYLMQV